MWYKFPTMDGRHFFVPPGGPNRVLDVQEAFNKYYAAPGSHPLLMDSQGRLHDTNPFSDTY